MMDRTHAAAAAVTVRPHTRSDIDSRTPSMRSSIARLSHFFDGFEVGHREPDDAIAVHVSKIGYVFFWLLVLFARCACILFLAGTTRVYWFVAHPYMSYYANLLGPQVAQQLKPTGICFGLAAVAHAFEVAQMVFYSVKSRRLVFDHPPSSKTQTKTTSVSAIVPARSVESKSPLSTACDCSGVFRFVAISIRTRWRMLFDRRGFFGVESDFFHVRFVSREFIEIVSQTWQVYNASFLIAKIWINDLYVALVLVNCFSTPLLQFVFHKSPPLERMLCLCCDLLLDAAVSMVIPLLIFVPYYEKFDFDMYNFELSYLYDDIWFANMVMENQQIFAQTKWDFVWTIVPHLSMYSCLSSLKALIRSEKQRKKPANKCMAASVWPDGYSERSLYSERSVAPMPASDAGSSSSPPPTTSALNKQSISNPRELSVAAPSQRQPQQQTKRQRTRLKRTLRTTGGVALKAVNGGLALWGLAILVLHVMAMRTSLETSVPGCKQATRPWFATKLSCSVLQYNCHQYNTTTMRVQDLEVLEDDSLVALVVSHCTALHMPPRIQKYRNLLGIDLFNCTLAAWNRDAAITNGTHPRLAYLIFVRVNMTKLPEGVLHQLPLSMTDFEISISNLTHLPPDLHLKWHAMSIVYVEHTQLTVFPETLRHLQVDDLSLIGSQISQLPEFPVDHTFFTLAMTHTPLEALPDSMGDLSAIGFLNLGHTQLKTLPSWIHRLQETATKVYVHHTPFCDSQTADERATTFGEDAVLTCTSTGDRVEGKYPLDLMVPRRLYEQQQPTTEQE